MYLLIFSKCWSWKLMNLSSVIKKQKATCQSFQLTKPEICQKQKSRDNACMLWQKDNKVLCCMSKHIRLFISAPSLLAKDLETVFLIPSNLCAATGELLHLFILGTWIEFCVPIRLQLNMKKLLAVWVGPKIHSVSAYGSLSWDSCSARSWTRWPLRSLTTLWFCVHFLYIKKSSVWDALALSI